MSARSYENFVPQLRHTSYVQPDSVNGRLRLRCQQPKRKWRARCSISATVGYQQFVFRSCRFRETHSHQLSPILAGGKRLGRSKPAGVRARTNLAIAQGAQSRHLGLSLSSQAGSIPGLVRIHLEESENHHAGDRNIQPNRERQARDSTMHRDSVRQREKERRQHHRQRDDRKDYVAG